MKIKKLFLLSLTSLLGCLSTAGCSFNDLNNWINGGENVLESTINESNEVIIKKLNSDYDQTNHVYRVTFSYVITPNYVKYDTPVITITFADDRQNGAEYLTTSVDPVGQTFSITCLKGFGSVATATVTFEGGVSGSVTLNYRQRLQSIDAGARPSLWLFYDSDKYNPTNSDQQATNVTYDSHEGVAELLTNKIQTNYGGGGPLFTITMDSEYTIPTASNYTYSSASVTNIVPKPLSHLAATIGDLIAPPGDDVSNTSDEYIAYHQFFYPALSNVDLMEPTPGQGIYYHLHHQWLTLTDAEKRAVAHMLDQNQFTSGGFCFNLDKTLLSRANAQVYFPDADATHLLDLAGYNQDWNLNVEPMPCWNIGAYVTNLTISDPSATF